MEININVLALSASIEYLCYGSTAMQYKDLVLSVRGLTSDSDVSPRTDRTKFC